MTANSMLKRVSQRLYGLSVVGKHRIGLVLYGFFVTTAVASAQDPIQIVYWDWDCVSTSVSVEFDQALDPSTATNLNNFSFGAGTTITNITFDNPPGDTIVFQVTGLSNTGFNFLTITNVLTAASPQATMDPDHSEIPIYCHSHAPHIDCPDDLVINCAPPGPFTTNVTVYVEDADGDPLRVVWDVNGQIVATNTVPAGGPPTSGNVTLTHGFPHGTNVVTVTVEDPLFEAECSFLLIVNPLQDPVIDCPQGPFEIFGADCANPEVFDLSGLVTMHGDCYTTNDFTFTHSPPVGTPLPHGTHLVTLTITGPNNFELDCDVLFIVDCPPDDDPCEVLCPDDLFIVTIVDCPAFMPDVTPYVTLSGNCDLSQYTLTQSIPVGTPLSNGVHWVNVNVTGPGGFDEDCRVTVVNECEDEPIPGGPCGTLLAAIPLNTGWDHNSNSTYNVGDVDAFWTVIDDPDTGTTEPRPAFVINQHPAWQPAMPNSRWISAYAGSANNLNGAYDLEFIFCLVEGWSNAVVDVALRVDDRAEVYLNGTLIGQTPSLFSFSSPTPTLILENNQALFQTGANSLIVRMINSHGVAMGLNLAGEVRADGLTLEDPLCCDPSSSISGQKFYDANQNGFFDPNETVLAGWTIEATDGTNTWTSFTDANGYYYFMGLPPGTYTITEVQQPNYIQTAPAGNSYTVTVGLAQGISGLDFGNYRDIKEPNQPPTVECAPDLVIECVDIGTNVSLTATLSDPDGDPLSYSWFINGSFYTSGGIPAGGPPTIGASTITPFLTIGTNMITVTVNDGSAEDACTFTVVIEEVTPPILHCRDQGVIVLPVNDDCEAILPPMPYVITPGCTPLNDLVITQTPPVGTVLGPGVHWITLEVYDPATGQSVFCRFQVQVVNRMPPRVICPQVEPVEDCEAVIPDLIPHLVIDTHCDSVADLTIIQTPPAGTVVGPGSHTITITVTDSSGNVAQCTSVFTVLGTGSAFPIDGLRNTGVNAAGSLLPLQAIDPHYELTQSADLSAPGPAAYVIAPRPPNWVANTTTSQWIAPTNTLQIHTPGQYVYEIEFTLPPTFSSAVISGTWATDNSAEIYLNGVATGITKPPTGFLSLTPFTITSGFVQGVNTLEFHIEALHRHTGLHVSDVTGTVWTCEEIEPCIPPSAFLSPIGQTVAWGGTATFSVFTSGTPPFTYQWYFNGSPMPGETNSTLTVSPATHVNAGLYHVVVGNPCGEVSSRRARLRVRRPWVVVIDNWVIGLPFDPPMDPPDPLDPMDPRPIIGDLGTPLDPLPLGPDPLDPYESTAVAAQFGRTTEFGIPGPDGVPVDVMQFTYNLPDTGYALTYDPAELPQQTIVLDVFGSEETSYLPLLSFDSDEGDDTVVYVQVGEGEPPADLPVVVIPVGTWTRVIVAMDADQGSLHGHVLLREGGTCHFDIYGTVAPGNGINRLMPSGADDHGVIYLRSLTWFSKVLTDLEIATLGATSSHDIVGEDPVQENARVGVSMATYAGDLSLRWHSGDFTAQQSTNLVDWAYIALTPILVTDTADEVEYRIDLSTAEQPMLFYRAATISPDIYVNHDHDDE